MATGLVSLIRASGAWSGLEGTTTAWKEPYPFVVGGLARCLVDEAFAHKERIRDLEAEIEKLRETLRNIAGRVHATPWAGRLCRHGPHPLPS